VPLVIPGHLRRVAPSALSLPAGGAATYASLRAAVRGAALALAAGIRRPSARYLFFGCQAF
jgi:hypothetical protein